MEKKIFNAPYLKVVEVKNDIIATSTQGRIGDDVTTEHGILAPRRGANIWSDGEAVEDLDF